MFSFLFAVGAVNEKGRLKRKEQNGLQFKVYQPKRASCML